MFLNRIPMYTLNSGCRIGRPRARNLQVHVECTISGGTLKPLLRQLKTRATGITGKDIPLKVAGKVSTSVAFAAAKVNWETVDRKLSDLCAIPIRSLANRRFHGFPLKLISTASENISDTISEFNSFFHRSRIAHFFFLSADNNSNYLKPILFKPIGKIDSIRGFQVSRME